MGNKKSKILQILILIIVVAVAIIATIKLLPFFQGLLTEDGRIAFKEKIESAGFLGVIIIIGLMMVQILMPVLPGQPVEMVAGMCYGTVGGLAVVTIGAFISSSIIFFLVRKFGRRFIYTFVSQEKIENLEKSKWFNNPKKIEIVFLILFLIPGMPKDLLVYIGGIMPVKALNFILISTFARIPAVLAVTTIGGNLLDGNWLAMAKVIGISTIITVLLVVIICKKGNIKKEDI